MTRFLAVSVALLGFLVIAPTAPAATCGDAPDGEPLEGALELREERSDLNIDFEKGSGEKQILMIFDVRNCSLARDEAIVVRPRSSDLSHAVFGEASVEADRQVLEVEVPVSADEFSPGKYEASVRVGAQAVAPTVQGVTIQRSEGWILPSLIAFFCGLIGFIAAIWVTRPSGSQNAKAARIGGAVFAVLVAVAAIWVASYVEPEVWEPDAASIVALLLGALPAAFGAATGVLAVKGGKGNS